MAGAFSTIATAPPGIGTHLPRLGRYHLFVHLRGGCQSDNMGHLALFRQAMPSAPATINLSTFALLYRPGLWICELNHQSVHPSPSMCPPETINLSTSDHQSVHLSASKLLILFRFPALKNLKTRIKQE
jgi:hypothetical protein